MNNWRSALQRSLVRAYQTPSRRSNTTLGACALEETPKRRHLYLLGTEQALKFLGGGRALGSVLSRNEKLREAFRAHYGSQFRTVGDYFRVHGRDVQIDDVSAWLSELADVVDD